MAGRPAYGTDYRRDFRTLRSRGLSLSTIATTLDVSLRTVERWEAERKAKARR